MNWIQNTSEFDIPFFSLHLITSFSLKRFNEILPHIYFDIIISSLEGKKFAESVLLCFQCLAGMIDVVSIFHGVFLVKFLCDKNSGNFVKTEKYNYNLISFSNGFPFPNGVSFPGIPHCDLYN